MDHYGTARLRKFHNEHGYDGPPEGERFPEDYVTVDRILKKRTIEDDGTSCEPQAVREGVHKGLSSSGVHNFLARPCSRAAGSPPAALWLTGRGGRVAGADRMTCVLSCNHPMYSGSSGPEP